MAGVGIIVMLCSYVSVPNTMKHWKTYAVIDLAYIILSFNYKILSAMHFAAIFSCYVGFSKQQQKKTNKHRK